MRLKVKYGEELIFLYNMKMIICDDFEKMLLDNADNDHDFRRA
jgi:hypothetical protein